MSWLDLPAQVRADPHWQHQFEEQRATASRLAHRVPLMHVSGKSIAFYELFATTSPSIPTSDEGHAYCSARTRHAEDVLELGRSVYFYAGHALPEFGQVALAFLPDAEEGHTGSATPFDTGGWVAEPPDPCIMSRLREGPQEAAFAFAKRVTVPLREWREYFEHYLAAYFNPCESYWSGRPCRVDPEELYDPFKNKDPRAWIVEIRFLEPQALDAVSAWCASPQEMEVLRRTTKRSGGAPREVRLSLRRFIQCRPALRPSGDLDYCGILVQWGTEASR